ncbi:MAG: hypothetical protein ACRYFY_16765, partial [Janthinobacterium lividum]
MQLPLAVRTALFLGPLLLSTAIASPAPASPAIVTDRPKPDPIAAASDPVSGPAGVRRPEQALGSYLAGTVAGHLGDSATAADLLLDALAHDPREPLLLQPAFLFSALAGRKQAPQLATRVEPSLIAQLVLANDAASRGDWDAASRAYSTLPPSPLNDAIRPVLLAWAQQGAGHTDLALATLAEVPSAGPLASASALQAAMIADLAGRKETASNLYRTAQAVFPGANLALTQALGGFLVRNGHAVEAQAMVHDLAQQISVLGMVEPGIVASLGIPVVATPRQGLARAYLAIASILQEQGPGGKEATAFILRFALDLQPDLTAAKLMLAELLAPDHASAAIDALANVGAADPLAP